MCAVKHDGTKGSFCDLTKSFTIKTEKDVREVSLPSFLSKLQSLTIATMLHLVWETVPVIGKQRGQPSCGDCDS